MDNIKIASPRRDKTKYNLNKIKLVKNQSDKMNCILILKVSNMVE